MENSFYYFFSAVPQVLGSVLGLLGVFVIFKVQHIRKQIFGIGQSVLDEIERTKWNELNVNKTNPLLKSLLNKAIHKEDINELSLQILSVQKVFDNDSFNLLEKKYTDLCKLRHNIIAETKYWFIGSVNNFV